MPGDPTIDLPDFPTPHWPAVVPMALDVRDLSAHPWPGHNVEGMRRGDLHAVGRLPGGATDGTDAVALLAILDDGSTVVVETTWSHLSVAVAQLAVHPVGLRGHTDLEL